MADPRKEEKEEGQQEEQPKKGKSKLLLMIIIAVLFLGGAGVGGFFFLKSQKQAEAQATAKEAESHNPQAAGEGAEAGKNMPAPSFFFDLPDLTVNLSSNNGESHFLRLKVALEVGSQTDLDALKEVQPRIVDDFQVYLRELRPEDLAGSAGTYRLRHDLLLRANQAAQPIQVKNVLFKEFLVQ